jgi:hypothetical protein
LRGVGHSLVAERTVVPGMTVRDSSLRAAPALAVCVATLLVAGCGGGGKGRAKVLGGSNNTRQTAPACSSTNLPTWSPDGTQIAFVGRRLHHGMLSVRAICVANADGKQAMPLPHTVCTRRCRLDLIDSPSQLFWVSPNLLLYGDDYRIFTIPVGGEPELLGREPGSFYQFSVDSAGDRVAAGVDPACTNCAGPVTVLDVPSGKLAGRIGGKKLDNIEPSLSPDGTQVVFVRNYANDSGRTKGIWTAAADGSHLRRLERSGEAPLWSPAGNRIAYLAPSGALRLVASQGGASKALVRGVNPVFGWSPDGKRIAFERGQRALEIVYVGTGKVRNVLRLRFGSVPSVVWSSNSQELLVRTPPKRSPGCASLWRVPVGGGKPQLLRNC